MHEDGGAVMTAGGAGASVSPIGGPQEDKTASAAMSAGRKKMIRRLSPQTVKESPEHGSEHTAHRQLHTVSKKSGFYLVNHRGERMHDTPHKSERDVIRAYKNLPDTTGVKIHRVT